MTLPSCFTFFDRRKGWAIAALRRHRSGGLRPEPAAPSQPSGRSSHIAEPLGVFVFLAAVVLAAVLA